MRPIDDEEAKWRRRSDARTLAEAEQIKADKERYNGAILGAKEIAKEEIARVQGIAKVANMKTPKTQNTSEICGRNNSQPTFGGRGYKNPATIGRL